MRLFGFCSIVAVALNIFVVAAQSLPQCGLICIVSNTQKSTCELSNITCICTNEELTVDISACVKTECNVHEQLLVKNYTMASCGVEPRDRSVMACILSVTFCILGMLAFFARVAARVVVGIQNWGADDWVMLLAVLLMIPLGVLSIPLKDNGLGKDIWTLTPKQITALLHIYFYDELIYLGVLPVIKISILLFYRRIFIRKPIRIAIWILIACNVSYIIAFEIVSIWQCDPLNGAWLSWDGTVEADCRNINAQSWSAASLNILLDLAMIVLPLPELANLSLSFRKKCQVLVMFSLGFFVTIVSIIRLTSLAKYGTHSENTTQDYTEIGYWSTIEVPVAVICACLPTIRSLLGHLFPRTFKSTHNTRSSYIRSNGASGAFSKTMDKNAPVRDRDEWPVTAAHAGHSASEVELTNFHANDGHSMAASGEKPTQPRESV